MALNATTRRWAWVGAAGLVAALVGVELFAWRNYRERQVVREVEAAVDVTLKSLSSKDPIVRRYGPFVRLEGEGFERDVHALGLPTLPIVIDRKAIFRDAWARITITVHPGQKLRLTTLSMRPSDSDAALLEPFKQGGELRFKDSPDWCGLHARVEHPQCPSPRRR